MRHLTLVILFLSSLAFGQEDITRMGDASKIWTEPSNPKLLKSNKLVTASHQQADLNLLSERAEVSTNDPLRNGKCGGFSCPDSTVAACLDSDDKVCSGLAKCVDERATCFEQYPCGLSEGFVCAEKYNDTLDDLRQAVKLHEELALENVTLRERRLNQKNCVLNASTLHDAQSCVRQP